MLVPDEEEGDVAAIFTNSANVKQSRLDSGLNVLVNVFETFQAVPSLIGNGTQT